MENRKPLKIYLLISVGQNYLVFGEQESVSSSVSQLYGISINDALVIHPVLARPRGRVQLYRPDVSIRQTMGL